MFTCLIYDLPAKSEHLNTATVTTTVREKCNVVQEHANPTHFHLRPSIGEDWTLLSKPRLLSILCQSLIISEVMNYIIILFLKLTLLYQ